MRTGKGLRSNLIQQMTCDCLLSGLGTLCEIQEKVKNNILNVSSVYYH